jgi:hypothetical protein
LAKVIADDGCYEIGEAFALGSLRSLEAVVEQTLKPVLLGKDPRDIERLWHKIYRTAFRYGRRGLVLAAMSAVDIALWDLLGKVCGLPVYKLAGGGYYLEGKRMDALADEARHYVNQGFTISFPYITPLHGGGKLFLNKTSDLKDFFGKGSRILKKTKNSTGGAYENKAYDRVVHLDSCSLSGLGGPALGAGV